MQVTTDIGCRRVWSLIAFGYQRKATESESVINRVGPLLAISEFHYASLFGAGSELVGELAPNRFGASSEPASNGTWHEPASNQLRTS